MSQLLCLTCNTSDRYKDGKCKNCVRLRVQAYQKKNEDKVKIWRKGFKTRHKENISIQTKEYYAKNKEKIAKYHAERRNDPAIKEALRSYKKQWKQNNPDIVSIQQHNRRSKIRAIDGTLSKNIRSVLWDIQKGRCVYCNIDLNEVTVHVDHIMPLALGGTNTDDNVQLTCAPCNYKKHYKHPDIFRKLISV